MNTAFPRIALLQVALPTLAFVLANTARAQTVTAIGSVQDATIYSDALAGANGSGSSAFVGRNRQGGLRRALLQFDLSNALPAGANIVSAEVELDIDRSSGASGVATLFSLSSAWTEGPATGSGNGGGQSAPAAAGDATWTDSSFNVSQWNSPGGDFAATMSASSPITGTGPQVFSDASLARDVAGWIANPSTNAGWMVIGNEPPGPASTAFSFRTREASSGAPILRITWTPGGTPAAVRPFGFGCMGATLSANSLPQLGNANFALSVTGGPSTSAPYFALVSTQQLPGPLGILSCFLFVNPNAIVVTPMFDAAGNRPLPVPNDPNNIGVTFHVQAASLDLSTPTLITTGGLTLVVGS